MPGPVVEGAKPAYSEVAGVLEGIALRQDIPAADLSVLKHNGRLLRATQQSLYDTHRMWLSAFYDGLTPMGAPVGDFKFPEDRALAAVVQHDFNGSNKNKISPVLTEYRIAGEDPNTIAPETAGHILTELGLVPDPIRDRESTRDRVLRRASNVIESVCSLEEVATYGNMRVPNPQTGEFVSVVNGPGSIDMSLELKNNARLGSLVSVLVGVGIVGERSNDVWIRMKVSKPDLKDPNQEAAFRRLIAVS